MHFAHRSQMATVIIFALTLLCSACGAPQPSLGTFKVNGKDAALGYAGLMTMEPVDGLPRMMLVIAEKAPAQGGEPVAATAAGAMAPTLSAPILEYPDKGWSAPVGFNYLHSASKKPHGWCAGNVCMLKDVVVKDGQFHARLVSTPTASGESVMLDLKLDIKMP